RPLVMLSPRPSEGQICATHRAGLFPLTPLSPWVLEACHQPGYSNHPQRRTSAIPAECQKTTTGREGRHIALRYRKRIPRRRSCVMYDQELSESLPAISLQPASYCNALCTAGLLTPPLRIVTKSSVGVVTTTSSPLTKNFTVP